MNVGPNDAPVPSSTSYYWYKGASVKASTNILVTATDQNYHSGGTNAVGNIIVN